MFRVRLVRRLESRWVAMTVLGASLSTASCATEEEPEPIQSCVFRTAFTTQVGDNAPGSVQNYCADYIDESGCAGYRGVTSVGEVCTTFVAGSDCASLGYAVSCSGNHYSGGSCDAPSYAPGDTVGEVCGGSSTGTGTGTGSGTGGSGTGGECEGLPQGFQGVLGTPCSSTVGESLVRKCVQNDQGYDVSAHCDLDTCTWQGTVCGEGKPLECSDCTNQYNACATSIAPGCS